MKKPRDFRPEPFEYHQEIELEIDDLTNLGSGVGRIDGWVVFVPYALPGERVRVRIWRNKKNYSDGDIVEILRPSPDRVEPECKLFGECGGCQYQHYSYASQLKWKQEQIRQLFRKMIGRDFEVMPCKGSEQIYHYRSKITPHFRKHPHQPGVPIGFEKANTRAIIDVDHCPIASDAINEALPLEIAKIRSGERWFKRGATILLRDAEDGVTTDMKEVVQERVGDYLFKFVAGEFFQNNPYVLPMLIEYALGEADRDGIDYLVDSYCGVGVFGICGHKQFKEVAGVEVNEAAVEQAKVNLELNKVENMSIDLGHAEAIFAGLQFPPEKTTILMDPPRKGSDELFLSQLVSFGPKRIVYVSCGPDTQARDVAYLLENGFKVKGIQPFDLFPHTRHIENVVTLERI